MPVHRRKAGLADRTKITGIRAMLKLGPSLTGGPEGRAAYDDMLSKLDAATNVSFEPEIVGGVPGWWCHPAERGDAAFLYFHGGAYVVGAAWAYRAFVSQLVARSGASAFIPDYGLGPERPFPAAFDDGVSTCRAIAARFDHLALVGDSAGGGLALAIASHGAHDAAPSSGPQPRGLALMSPWTDLSLSGASMTSKADDDPLLTREMLAAAVHNYLGEGSARDPRASPVFADLSALPPLLIHVGKDEVPLDDSTRVMERIEASGGDARVEIWASMIHVFPSMYEHLTTSTAALDDIGQSFAPDCGRCGLEPPLSVARFLLRLFLPAKLLRRSGDISAALPVCAPHCGNVLKGPQV